MGRFKNARSGIRRIAAFDPSEFPVQIAGEVRDIDPYLFLNSKDRQHVCRAAVLALNAARQALNDANLNPEILSLEDRRRIGVILGSGGGGLEFTERQYAHWYSGEPKKASVYTIPTSTIGGMSSEISMAFRLHGPSHVDFDRMYQFDGCVVLRLSRRSSAAVLTSSSLAGRMPHSHREFWRDSV